MNEPASHFTPVEVAPYEKLAGIYNEAMSHIDYAGWVGYLEDLCNQLGIHPKLTLDISAGTGNTVPFMQPWCGELYCMDLSLPMIRVLYHRFPELRARTWVGEMSALATNLTFDLIVNLQDSVNYYTEISKIQSHLDTIYTTLRPSGTYIFDFSTENNVKNNFIDLHEIYENEHHGYERLNTYFSRQKLNLTEFRIWQEQDGKRSAYLEKHLQRMYDLDEIVSCLESSPFDSWDLFEDETFDQPTKHAERVHVVARRNPS